MGRGFSPEGRTGVKECLAFQTHNPLLAVWNASPHWSTHACPHRETCALLPLWAQSLCPPHQRSGRADRSDKEKKAATSGVVAALFSNLFTALKVA